MPGVAEDAPPDWLIVATSWAGWPEDSRPSSALVGEELATLDDTWATDSGRRFLVVIEDPATMLAARVSSLHDGTAAEQLAAWHRAARRLLRWMHLHRSRCLCLHSDDLRRAGEGASALLTSARVPGALAGSLRDVVPVDAITLAIAQSLVDREPALPRLNAELQASCDPVATATAVSDTDLLAAALAQLGTLQHDARRAAALAPQVEALKREAEDCGVRLRDAQREHRRLLTVTEELDAALVRGDALTAERQSLRESLSDMTSQLEHAERGRVDLQRACDAARSEARRLAHALATSDAAKAALTQQVTDLLPLDTRFALTRDGQTSGTRRLSPTFAGVAGAVVGALKGRIEGMHVGMAHGPASHRGLDIDIGAITVGSHHVRQARVRLVEHLGRPGVVFFAAEDGAAPLLQWTPNGDEGGRAFMLLIPEDPAHRNTLLRLGSTDWATVLLCVAGAELALSSDPLHAADLTWARQAARVRLTLDNLPVRLRYDDLQMAALSDGPAVRFVRALWGAQVWPGLTVQLHPEAGPEDARILLPSDACAPPPLRAWPVDPNGGPAGHVAFSHLLQPAVWRALPDGDRDLVVSLLDALHNGGPAGDPQVRQAARALRRRAAVSQRQMRRRRIIARLLRRSPEAMP